MFTKFVSTAVIGTLAILVCGAAFSDQASHLSPYAGQENRQISSLSDSDVEELVRGGGWGLAKAAELNGLPGPAHLLEMKDKIGLTSTQVAEIVAVRDVMRADAKRLGRKLIDLERSLDLGFKSKSFSPETLESALSELGSVRSQLRFTHLSAHLHTPAILTGEQIARYNHLRGYSNRDDPCENAPHGHDVSMWRKHNGCE